MKRLFICEKPSLAQAVAHYLGSECRKEGYYEAGTDFVAWLQGHILAQKMPEEYKIYCKEHHIKYKEYTDFNEETIADADILYMTRVQRERFTDLMEYERVKDVYILRNKMLEHTRPNLRILHPLPRVNEIAYDVDENPKAYYFQQAKNGLYARQAILCDVLGITLDEVKADTEK